ncbi:MAG: hypothetical protein ACLRMN_00845 [Mediterraneibacter gnavus]
MDASTSVAVGDRSFVIYEGTKSVKKENRSEAESGDTQ